MLAKERFDRKIKKTPISDNHLFLLNAIHPRDTLISIAPYSFRVLIEYESELVVLSVF